MLYCKTCGSAVEEYARFCEKCSARLDNKDNVLSSSEYAMRENSGGFNPDTVRAHIDLTLFEVMGRRITEKLFTVLDETYYSAVSLEGSGPQQFVIRHVSFPTEGAYNKLCLDFSMDASKADSYLKDVARKCAEELEAYRDICRETGINCPYEESAAFYSKENNTHHLFLRMKPVQPLLEYIKHQDMTVRECVRIVSQAMEQLALMHKHEIVYGALTDQNLMLDADGNVYLGSREQQIFNQFLPGTGPNSGYIDLFLPPDTPMTWPGSIAVDIYSAGILLYRLLNCYRHPFENIYQQRQGYETYKKAEKDRQAMLTPQMPFFAQNNIGTAVLRACAPVSTRFRNVEEFKRIIDNSLNYLPAEELNRPVIVYDKLSAGVLPFEQKAAPPPLANAVVTAAQPQAASDMVGVSRQQQSDLREGKDNDNKKSGAIILVIISAVLLVVLSVLFISERRRDRSYKTMEAGAVFCVIDYDQSVMREGVFICR